MGNMLSFKEFFGIDSYAGFKATSDRISAIWDVRETVPHVAEELKNAENKRQNAIFPNDRGNNSYHNAEEHDQNSH